MIQERKRTVVPVIQERRQTVVQEQGKSVHRLIRGHTGGVSELQEGWSHIQGVNIEMGGFQHQQCVMVPPQMGNFHSEAVRP